jgi:mRNA interferase RelE/StbE
MPWTVEFVATAREAFLALPRALQVRVGRAVDGLAADPRPHGAKTLQGKKGLLRIRVGDYRVIYRIEKDRLVVLVVKIGPRRDVYRRL